MQSALARAAGQQHGHSTFGEEQHVHNTEYTVCAADGRGNASTMSFSDLAQAVSRLPQGMRRFQATDRQRELDLLDDLPDGTC